MPKCREMSELVTDYMEQALPWERRIPVWWHLRLCSLCRAYYDQLAKLSSLLRARALPGPDADRELALLAALRPGPAPPRSH
jgi:predicted anti-sigma-YlaC factor YlaD